MTDVNAAKAKAQPLVAEEQESRGAEAKTPCYLFVAGGTSGHIHPALAIAEGLKKRQPQAQILFCGTEQGLENKVVQAAGFPFLPIEAAALPLRPSLRFFSACRIANRGRKQARAILRTYQPKAVIGTGGYVCAPVLAAAKQEGIPILLHEQNALPGRNNRLFARMAKSLCLAYPEALAYFRGLKRTRCKVTGNPVRAEAFLRSGVEQTAKAKAELGLSAELPLILVTGGSLGARALNQTCLDLWEELLKSPASTSETSLEGSSLSEESQVSAVLSTAQASTASEKQPSASQQAGVEAKAQAPTLSPAVRQLLQNSCQMILATGHRLYEECEQRVASWPGGENSLPPQFQLRPYLQNMLSYLAAADLVVSRSGASTVFEICALGKPSLLIPYPYAAGDHQRRNAEALVARKAAICVPESDWNKEVFADYIVDFLKQPESWAQRGEAARSLAQADAVDQILDELEEIC